MGSGNSPSRCNSREDARLEVGAVLALERQVVVDQLAEPDGVVAGEHLPEERLDVVLAGGSAHRTLDECALQVLGRNGSKVLQRGQLGLVAASDDDDERLKVTLVAPPLRLLDLGAEDVAVYSDLLRRLLAARSQVRDAQVGERLLVVHRFEPLEERLRIGREHVADDHPNGSGVGAHGPGDELGEELLGRARGGRHTRTSGSVVTIVRPSA